LKIYLRTRERYYTYGQTKVIQRVFLCSNHSETNQPRRATSTGAKHILFVVSSNQDELEAR